MQIDLQNDNIISYKIKHSIESFALLEIELLSEQKQEQEIELYDNGKIIFTGSMILKESLSSSIKYHFESNPQETIEKYLSEQIIYKNNIKSFKHMIYTDRLCNMHNMFFYPDDLPININTHDIIRLNYHIRAIPKLPTIKLNFIYKTFEIYREKSPHERYMLTQEDIHTIGSDTMDYTFANIHEHMNISIREFKTSMDDVPYVELFEVEIDHKIQTINYDQYIIGNSEEYDILNVNVVIYENIEQYNQNITYHDNAQFKDENYCYVKTLQDKKKIPFIRIGKTFDATDYGKEYIGYYKQKILYEHYYHQYTESFILTMKNINMDIEIYKRITFQYQNKEYMGYIAQYHITPHHIEMTVHIIKDINKNYFEMSFDDQNRSEFTARSYKIEDIQEHTKRKCRLTKDSKNLCTIYFTKEKNSDIFLSWMKKFIINI